MQYYYAEFGRRSHHSQRHGEPVHEQEVYGNARRLGCDSKHGLRRQALGQCEDRKLVRNAQERKDLQDRHRTYDGRVSKEGGLALYLCVLQHCPGYYVTVGGFPLSVYNRKLTAVRSVA